MSQQRIDWPSCQAYGRAAGEGAETVERLRRAIDDAPQELGSDANRPRALARDDARVGTKAMRIARWHEVETVTGKTDHFRCGPGAVAGNDIAVVADGCLTASRLERQADHAG